MYIASKYIPVLILVTYFTTILALDHAANGQSAAVVSLQKSELDGMRFVGPLAVEGEVSPEEDVLIFKDGKFVSENCKKWGFSAAPYWVRRDAKGIRFLADLESREHGKMRYEGVFDGKELRGVALWKKERWYWTSERTYRFKGRLVPSSR